MSQVSAFPITREDFEGRKDDVSKKEKGWIEQSIGQDMSKLPWGERVTDTIDLWATVRGIDKSDGFLYSQEDDTTLRAIRDAFEIHKYTYTKVIGPKAGIYQEGLNPNELEARTRYANLHSLFLGVGYAISKIEGLVEKMGNDRVSPNLDKFVYQFYATEAENKKYGLGKLAAGIKKGNLDKIINDSKDVVNYTLKHLKKVEELILTEKEKFRLTLKTVDGKDYLMNELENVAFDIDGVRFMGWKYEGKKEETPRLEFKEVKPHEVIGNSLAKKDVLRDSQRLALYNFKKYLNPILEYGGLGWSSLWTGLPGTGKTTMMQMQMTYLKYLAEMLDVPYNFYVIDASEKNEYYGKAQRDYRDKLKKTTDKNSLNQTYFDDVDLIVPGRQSFMNGADQDILKLFMDYLAGVTTLFRGNAIAIAATNNAATMDPAWRQRFKSHYSIDGPTTPEQCAALFYVKFSKQIKMGIIEEISLGGLDPKKVQDAFKGVYRHELSPQTVAIMDKLGKKKTSNVTWMDIGSIAKGYQDIDPRFTGRFIDNSVSNAIIRAADFDIPEEIYSDPKRFKELEYDKQVGLLKDFFHKITSEHILTEMDRYFQSEIKYMEEDKNNKLQNRTDDLVTDFMAQAALHDRLKRLDVRKTTPD